MLPLTFDWPRYHRCLGVLLTDLRMHTSGRASSCAPSSQLYTDFLCLLANLLGFEVLPPDTPVDTQTRCWLDIIAATARFLRSVGPTPFPMTPPLPAHTCSTPSSADSTTTMDSLDCLRASACLTSPSENPRLLSHSLSCWRAQVPSVFASDLVSDDEVPIPFLHVPSPSQPSAHAAAASLADRDYEVHIPRIPPRCALVSCDNDDEVLIPRPKHTFLSLLHLPLSLPSSWAPLSCPPGRFLGPAFPAVVPKYLVRDCARDQVSDDEVPIPCLHVTSLPRPSAPCCCLAC
jgi:hypothetical protein